MTVLQTNMSNVNSKLTDADKERIREKYQEFPEGSRIVFSDTFIKIQRNGFEIFTDGIFFLIGPNWSVSIKNDSKKKMDRILQAIMDWVNERRSVKLEPNDTAPITKDYELWVKRKEKKTSKK